jgi:hypothetical protein
VAQLREACRGDKPDVSRTDYRYPHPLLPQAGPGATRSPEPSISVCIQNTILPRRIRGSTGSSVTFGANLGEKAEKNPV